MTVAWDTVQTAIYEFAKATDVIADDVQIHWEDEAKPHMRGDYLWLRIVDERSVGWDDVEEVEVDEDGVPVPTPGSGVRWVPRITGIREFGVEFEYRARNQTALRAARNALETIRASLQNPVRRAVLDDAGVGFLAAMPVRTEVRSEHDERRESVAILRAEFSVLSVLFDTSAAAAVTHVQSVEGTFAIERPEGGTVNVEISEGG